MNRATARASAVRGPCCPAGVVAPRAATEHSRLRHGDLQFSILCLYTSLGYAAALPKNSLRLVAQAQSAIIRKLMAGVGRLLGQTETVSSKWQTLGLLKATMAETRRKERGRAAKANSKHLIAFRIVWIVSSHDRQKPILDKSGGGGF